MTVQRIEDRAHPVALAAAAMLDQCAAFIRSVPGDAYTAPSETLKGGTIGKHVRHTLDHFRAALMGHTNSEVIDYDRRERDVPMETLPAEALRAIDTLRRMLSGLSCLDGPVRVRLMMSAGGEEIELGSTLARELAFASHHAVHHHAMLAAIAAEMGVDVGTGFGKAPSTLAFEQAER